MANEFLELKSIARNALPRLMENLVMPNLCYKDYSNEFTNLGDTIQVKKPVVLEAKDFAPGDTVSSQEIKEESVDIKMDKIATVDINIGALQAVHNMDESKFISDFIEPATVALAEKINGAGLDMYKFIGQSAGTAGTTPAGLADFAAARKLLNKAKVPMAGRVAIWNPDADAAFTQIGNIVKVNESGSPAALREGEIGRIYGLDNYMAQGVKDATAGITAATAVKLNGATTSASTTLSIDGTSLTGKLMVGDIIKIGNACYTVAEESATAASNAIANIKVNEPIKAHADNANVTLVYGGAQNLIFHKNAIAFVTRPLHAPAGVDSYTTSFNGFSLRVVRGYDINTKTEKMSMDVLYNYKVVYPEMAMRYLG